MRVDTHFLIDGVQEKTNDTLIGCTLSNLILGYDAVIVLAILKEIWWIEAIDAFPVFLSLI